MILSDRDIQREISSGNIKFDPPIKAEDISPSSVDVHLGSEISVFKPAPSAVYRAIDLSHPEVAESFADLLETMKIPHQGYDLLPGSFILSRLRERLTLCPTIAARIEGRSTNARFGLAVHVTAPVVHATYSGYLTLEMCNLGKMPIRLKTGLPVAQLVFERLESPPQRTLQSHWQNK